MSRGAKLTSWSQSGGGVSLGNRCWICFLSGMLSVNLQAFDDVVASNNQLTGRCSQVTLEITPILWLNYAISRYSKGLHFITVP